MSLLSSSLFRCPMAQTRRVRTRSRRDWLQHLEPRTLLSAVIQVSGNSSLIANQDTTPSLDDFTDFGPISTTFNAAIGRVTRSFVISNVGDAPLALVGGTKQIKITGAHAKDFVLTVNPASTIDAGGHETFTLTFIPKGTGLRRATVSVFSDDPDAATYTFNIQGTAARTTNAANGLQVATITKGTGPGAVHGAAILVNYTAFFLTSKFESSQESGGTPVDLRLGISNTIAGMTQGLTGIKAGETRLLVIPSDLAYGASGQNDIPPNTPLIFLVTATTMANPSILVTGNDLPIAYKDKTPSVTDGTFLGATPPGSTTSLVSTFKVANGSDGIVVFPLSPIITITGKDAASFTASNLVIDGGGTFATFTVTYQPSAKAGTQSAIVHVRNSDPLRKDFTFTVSATTSPFIDFSGTSVGTINFPASGSTLAGALTKFKVPVTLTNLGNTNVPGTTPPLQFTIYLHDTTTGVDTLISTQTTPSFRGTSPGKSKTLPFIFTIPAFVPAGTYQLLIKFNENNAVTETSLSNNSVLSTQHITVTV